MLDIAINTIKNSINTILSDYSPSFYLYGSVTLNDFQYGWSDIDILCLTAHSILEKHAQELVGLRQKLINDCTDDIYGLFEGAFLSINAFVLNAPDMVVYWGTSGQRVTDKYYFDSFSMYQLKTTGRLLCGADVRSRFPMPSYDALKQDVIRHYQNIRKYAITTNDSLYSCGWLLDIARCLYTLRTGKVISKTMAGEWALEERICNVPATMQKTIEIRKNPQAYKNDPQYKAWARQLGKEIQRFADVLEHEIGQLS